LHDRNACFRPTEQRERLPAANADEPPDPRTAASSACRHDGECNLTGCGNVCVSYRVGPMETNCIGYEWLDRAQFCGCVAGTCAFFKQ